MLRIATLALLMLPVVPPATGQTGVFLEVPLMVQAPGFQSAVRAYHDGEDFFVDIARLWEHLGYTVERQETMLTAADSRHQFVLDFEHMQVTRTGALPVSLAGNLYHHGDRYLVAVESLDQFFGSDIFFDEARLSLQLSTAAEHFSTFALGSRGLLGSEVTGPLKMGRERHLLGGLVAAWYVSRQWLRGQLLYSDEQVHFSSSMLGGAVGGVLGRTSEVTYLFDRPGSPLLTRLELGRMASLDAVRLSNLPLASPHLQRTTTLQGHAAPHSMAEVLVSGRVIDRVLTDQNGRYRLRVPAYYGTTEAIVRIQPLGGAPAYEERHHLLVPPALAPPHRLYYDAILGNRGQIHIRYGALSRLTARLEAQHRGDFRTGLVANPWSFVVLSAAVSWPPRLVQGSAHLWRRLFSVEAVFDPSHSYAVFTGRWRQFGMQVTGNNESRLSSWLFWHGRSGTSARVHVQNGPLWHAAAHRVIPIWGGVLQLGLFARSPRTSGAELLLSTRRLGLGVTMAYDPVHQGLFGQVTFQVHTRALAVASRAHSNGVHAHSASGSISIGPDIRFSRALRGETAALLRVFEDMNDNGRLDPGEPLLPEVDVQIFQASLQRTASGTLRASFLEPYAAYQIQVLEQSIRDPWLRPTTGYTFSFIADPGRTKRINIPMRRVPLARGRVLSHDRPASRLRVRALQEDHPVGVSDVYRDGGFALRLEQGTYVLLIEDIVEDNVVHRQPLTVPAGQRILDIVISLE